MTVITVGNLRFKCVYNENETITNLAANEVGFQLAAGNEAILYNDGAGNINTVPIGGGDGDSGGGVTSINNQTGAVTLAATDIGAVTLDEYRNFVSSFNSMVQNYLSSANGSAIIEAYLQSDAGQAIIKGYAQEVVDDIDSIEATTETGTVVP